MKTLKIDTGKEMSFEEVSEMAKAQGMEVIIMVSSASDSPTSYEVMGM